MSRIFLPGFATPGTMLVSKALTSQSKQVANCRILGRGIVLNLRGLLAEAMLDKQQCGQHLAGSET